MFAKYTETDLYLKPATAENCISAFPNADLVGTIESKIHERDVVAFRGICDRTGQPFLAVSIGKFRSLDLNEPTHFFKVLGNKTSDGEVKYQGCFEIPYRPMDGEEVRASGTIFQYRLTAFESYDASGKVNRIGGTGWPVQS